MVGNIYSPTDRVILGTGDISNIKAGNIVSISRNKGLLGEKDQNYGELSANKATVTSYANLSEKIKILNDKLFSPQDEYIRLQGRIIAMEKEISQIGVNGGSRKIKNLQGELAMLKIEVGNLKKTISIIEKEIRQSESYRDYIYTRSYYNVLTNIFGYISEADWLNEMKNVYGCGIILVCDREKDGPCDRLVAHYLESILTERDYYDAVMGLRLGPDEKYDSPLYIPELMVNESGAFTTIEGRSYKKIMEKVYNER